MSNVQILPLAIALSTSFLAVFIGVFLNNNRLNDVKELMGAKIESSRAGTSKEIAELRAGTSKEIAELRGARKVEFADLRSRLEMIGDNLARILADHEHRLTQLEGGKN